MSKVEQICLVFGDAENKKQISYDDYDKKNLVFKPVNVDEKDGYSVITIPVLYKCPDGKERGLNFQGATQTTYGVNLCHDMKVKEEERGPQSVTGYQIGYPMYADPKRPTENEKLSTQVFQDIYELGRKHLKKIIEEEGEDAALVPDNVVLTVNGKEGGFKPPFAHPKKADPKNPKKKIPDTDKPKQAYIKLKSYGKTGDQKISTKFWHRGGDKNIPIPDCVGSKDKPIRLKIEPTFSIKGIFLGGHGTTPYGASGQFKIHDANVWKVAAGEERMSRKRAEQVDDEDSDDDVTANFGSSSSGKGGDDDDWGDSPKKKNAGSKASSSSSEKSKKLKDIPVKAEKKKPPPKKVDESDDEASGSESGSGDESGSEDERPPAKPKASAKKASGKKAPAKKK